jgi:hypothetical protein
LKKSVKLPDTGVKIPDSAAGKINQSRNAHKFKADRLLVKLLTNLLGTRYDYVYDYGKKYPESKSLK